MTYGAGGGCNAVNGAYGGVSRKITVPAKGTVNMAVNGTCSIGSGDIYYGVFMDQNMTQPVNDSSYNVISAGSGKEEGNAFSVPAGGTYYVGVYSDISSGQKYTVISLAAYASGTGLYTFRRSMERRGTERGADQYVQIQGVEHRIHTCRYNKCR